MKTMWKSVALVGVALIAACGDSTKVKGTTIATLEAFTSGRSVEFGDLISVSPSGMPIGSEKSVGDLKIINTGEKVLDIDSITIESEPAGAFRLASDRDALTPLGSGPFEVAPQFSAEGERSLDFYIVLKRPAANIIPTATITIRSNSINNETSNPEVTFDIIMEEGAPSLSVVPKIVDFETVSAGATESKSVNLLNQGTDDLHIEGFVMSGHPNFELQVGITRYRPSAVVLDEPLVVPPGELVAVTVFYTADGPEAATGRIVFDSNDPKQPGGTVVDLLANVGGPCISLNPKKADFGGKLIGSQPHIEIEVTSCGTKPLQLTEIVLLADSSEEFTLKLDTLPGIGAGASGALGPQDSPVTLNPNQTARFAVQYLPLDLSPIDATGLPIRDTGSIRIRSNAFVAETLVEVSGFGVDVECPTAIIQIEEGEEVRPQTVLHLIGSQSFAATGTIQKWQWSVQQPLGSASVFKPTNTKPDPTFEANVAGRYVFELRVTDTAGVESCAPALAEVFVNPDEAIHIELLWNTPNDLDQTDTGPEAGADLDLHFLHPFAVGTGFDGDKDGKPDGYFDIPYDTFWFNDSPNWGAFEGIDDDPGLDRDDTDGAGPENVNLNIPENLCYKIGVHYWDDKGLGESTATVRVYLYASLVFEMADVSMINLDMWTVTDICWPPDPASPPKPRLVCAGTTTACTSDAQCGGSACGPLIVKDYQQNILPQP